MKSIEIFCASPASTAICTSMDQRAIVRHGTKSSSSSFDHRNRSSSNTTTPCSSHLPIDPSKPFFNQRKSTTNYMKDSSSYSDNNNNTNSNKQLESLLDRKSSAYDVDDLSRSPRGSSRYLLSDKPYMDFIFDSQDERALQVSSQPVITNDNDNNNNYKRMVLKTSTYESPVYKPSDVRGGDDEAKKDQNKSLVSLNDRFNVRKTSSAAPINSNHHQVVELMVSIHCKGCEGKLRKHISRMEGVTSFSIDLETKKVIVIGNMTPLEVLTSISKVKYAQFWPSTTSSSSSSSSSTPRISLAR